MELNEHIYPDSRIRDVMRHPAFDGKGRLLFPWDEPERYQDDMTMMDVPQMNLWHTNQDVNEMVGGVNRMIDDRADGKQVLFDIYTEEELAADSSKRNTGLFFFRGKPGMPFAVVRAGGGFCYVGSLHEGFPVAMEINRSGYNAFVLKYRTNCSGKDSSEDLLRAVRFIRDHAKELEVDNENYSLWGGSAGARLCSYVTYLGSGFIKPGRKLHPAADIIAYTYFDFKPRFMPEDSPGFFITGTRDWLVPVSSTRADADRLRKQGVPVEVHAPEGAEHGFGVGNGTPAEGWANALAEKEGFAKFVSIQGHYNLIFREEEREMVPYCEEENIALTPYSALASGRLSRKPGENDTKRAAEDAYAKFKYDATADQDNVIISRVAELSEKRGVTMTELFLAWLLTKVTAPVVGATKLHHIEGAVKAVDIELTDSEIAYLEEPYVPHPLAGVMAQNKRTNAGENHGWGTGNQK